MNETILKVNYLIEGIISTIPTKMIYEQSKENELSNIHFEINFGKHNIKSKTCNAIEYATVCLQKALPANISIACCQSCRYGNFCPYGDADNEIFCLKNVIPRDKEDVCTFFAENRENLEDRTRKLLDFCKEYKPMADNKYYTYNDWEYNLTHYKR
ncbi:hypothetical protein [Clostridium sp.]|uniref:hypothetical protein n=1 Tax=Clostridium sp. TaxID=1506 RepID=UPI00283B9F6E|nr:hypothetical protein [Clostridium sp.]MDR3598045.1 hypothetical protein [Clostridium sp.]